MSALARAVRAFGRAFAVVTAMLFAVWYGATAYWIRTLLVFAVSHNW